MLVLPLRVASLILLDQLLTRWIIPAGWLHENSRHWSTALPLLLTLLAGLFLVSLIWLKLPLKHRQGWPISCMLAGLLSNLIFSLTTGTVPDYIPLYYWFSNLADVFVIVGCAALFIFLLAKKTP